MTRAQALEVLRCLAGGLTPDVDGCDRLLERASATEEPEALRAALTEAGALALLLELRPEGRP